MKVTIKGIIKENREDLLIDKIVESLLNDTEYQVYHRFMGEIVCKIEFPMFNETKIYDRIDIREFKNIFWIGFHLFEVWNKYIDSNYGITDSLMINKIGVRYYNILSTRILEDFDNYNYIPDYGSINESVENKEQLIVDKISNFILDDTEVGVNQSGTRVSILFPFYGTENYYTIEKVLPILFQRRENIYTRSPEILTYIQNTYGIDDPTIIFYISQRYYSLLNNKVKELLESNSNPINESVNNREEQIINKISQYMLEDTEYEYNQRGERVIIFFPFYKVENYYTLERVLPILLNRGYDIDMINYIQNTYSIKDWNLIVNISHRYYRLLYYKIKDLLESSNNPINESVERKEEVINRIVDFMVQDTKWDIHMEEEEDWEYVEVTIYYPGGDEDVYKIKDMENDWDMYHTGYSDERYIKDNFGITENWIIQELYNRYINKLRPIIYEEMKDFENNY